MYPENEEIISIECGPYINPEIIKMEKTYEGTEHQWATPEIAFDNAIDYIIKTIVKKRCHYYEGIIALTIWEEKLSKFKAIIDNENSTHLNLKKLLEARGVQQSKTPLVPNKNDIFVGMPFYSGARFAIEIMKETLFTNFHNIDSTRKALLILEKFQEEYESILRNSINKYAYFNILLPRYGISEPRAKLEISEPEYLFIQQKKYNFFQKIWITAEFPKETMLEIEAFASLKENMNKTTNVFEIRNLLVDFYKTASLEETKQITKSLIEQIESSCQLENSTNDSSLLDRDIKENNEKECYRADDLCLNSTNSQENIIDDKFF